MRILLFLALLLLPVQALAFGENLMNINAVTAPVMSCTSSSSRVAFSNSGSPNVTVINTGSVDIFVVTGTSSITATFPTSSAVTGSVVPAGWVVTMTKNKTDTHIACITASGTATAYASTGIGE